MYIREFAVRNYMIHRDTNITLRPLTVFVGPNGGGKSAFFDAMLNFSMLSRGNLRQAFGPYPYSFRATVYRGAGKLPRIGYRVSMARSEDAAEWLHYEIDYSQAGMVEDQPSFTIFTERLTRHPDGTILFDRAHSDEHQLGPYLSLENDRSLFSALRVRHLTSPDVEVDDLVAYCATQISRFNKFRLDPNVLAQPSRIPDTALDAESTGAAPRLGYHGEDLAATLYYLHETRSGDLDAIRDRLRTVGKDFVDFEFNTVGTDRIAFSMVFSDSRQTVPSVRLSSGTLIYLGLIALVSTANRPPVLMVEEPENGLTPQAVKAFYKAVKSLAYGADAERRSQVLISSHSPFVICEAWNGDDRDFIHQVKVVNGKAQIRNFSEAIAEQGVQLQKDAKGHRTVLGLKTAEEVMSGYLS
jgi:predicted ATPase